MNNAFLKSFQTLKEVYENKAFSSIALNRTLAFCTAKDRALVTKVVYGVLDNDIKLGYIVSKYTKKYPKGDALLFLKIGAYCLAELSIPQYAVVNDIAELSKISEDKRIVGFVNATLKNIAKDIKTFDDYPQDKVLELSVKYSYPEWALRKLIKDYGEDEAEKIVTYPAEQRTTVRIVKNERFAEYSEMFGDVDQTLFDDAFYASGKLPELDEKFTVQSLSSMAVARICAFGCGQKALDCCSAPGGKAVYLKQLCPQTEVVSCDIHPHRVELIKSYAQRMKADIKTYCRDMTERYAEWDNMFDTVLCDVPCSGFGVLNNRPDIKLFRKNEDISSLMKLQYAILSNCANYVKVGGRLVYSTCTVFDNENGQNVRKFLKEHNGFTYGEIILPNTSAHRQPFYQFLPHKDGIQGFYVAVLKRVE